MFNKNKPPAYLRGYDEGYAGKPLRDRQQEPDWINYLNGRHAGYTDKVIEEAEHVKIKLGVK